MINRAGARTAFAFNFITAPSSVLCAIADDWYVITGTFGSRVKDFTVSAAGLVTYTGVKTVDFDIKGAAGVMVDKACTVTIGSRFNGVDQPSGTSQTFLAQSPNGTIVQYGLPPLITGDNFLALVKSDVTNTTVTFETLFGTFYGPY